MLARSSPAFRIASAWIAIALGAFGYALSRDAGAWIGTWLVVMFVFQAPPLIALAQAERGRPLHGRRELAIGGPAVLMVLIASVSIGMGIGPHAEWGTKCIGAATCTAAVYIFGRALRRRAHPAGVRLVLIAVTLAGAASLLAQLLLAPGAWRKMTLAAIPLLWTLPLWLLLARRAPSSIPEARVHER